MRPIDADALLNGLPDDLPYKASVKRVLLQAPTLDVVPREEVERIKRETAREIFAVIDTLGTYNPTLYAELKKKYTEDSTDRKKTDR